MIKQLSTKNVYQNKWMAVREDQVEFANGSQGIYGIVDKPHFALIIPFDGTHFWLVNQFRYPVQESYWEFPQGLYEDKPETDPLSMAKQELAEEAGLYANSWQKIGFLYEAYGYSTQGFYIFLASNLEERKQHPEISEAGMNFAKFTVSEFEGMIVQGKITDATSISAFGLMKAKKLC